jgi:hypothetical protein
MEKIILTIIMVFFLFSIKEKMTYTIPTQCGKILYKKEIVEGTTSKSNVIYETRKRFTIAWSDGTISEKYPLDNDYYHYEVGQKICYDRPELLTHYQSACYHGFFCIISGVILFVSIIGIIIDYNTTNN